MFRRFKLATVIAVALSACGTIDSAQAHIGGLGGRGGGVRIGGGLAPRGRQPGNANGIRNNGNPGVVAGTKPVPKAVVVPPVVQIGGTKPATVSKPPVASPSSKTTQKPSVAHVIGNNSVIKSSNALKDISDKVQSPTVQAKVLGAVGVAAGAAQAHKSSHGSGNHQGHLVFNLTGDAAPVETAEADANATVPAAPPKGLSSEAKKALEEALATDAPADESTPSPAAENVAVPPDFVSKEAALPQIPVGATVTLNGRDLSTKQGQVVLQIGDIALPATITDWKNNMVTCTLPVLGLTKPSKATLHVLKTDGKTASMLECEIVTTLPTAAKPSP